MCHLMTGRPQGKPTISWPNLPGRAASLGKMVLYSRTSKKSFFPDQAPRQNCCVQPKIGFAKGTWPRNKVPRQNWIFRALLSLSVFILTAGQQSFQSVDPMSFCCQSLCVQPALLSKPAIDKIWPAVCTKMGVYFCHPNFTVIIRIHIWIRWVGVRVSHDHVEFCQLMKIRLLMALTSCCLCPSEYEMFSDSVSKRILNIYNFH